jgi:hypothetical protein
MSGLMNALAGAAIVGMVAAAVVAWFQLTVGAERKRRNRFAERDVLSFDAWFDRYYGDADSFPPAQVRALLEMFAEEIGVKRTQLRPGDRLHTDLSLGSRFALDESWLEWSAELQELSADFGGPELELEPEWETLDDLIRGVIGQIRGGAKVQG